MFVRSNTESPGRGRQVDAAKRAAGSGGAALEQRAGDGPHHAHCAHGRRRIALSDIRRRRRGSPAYNWRAFYPYGHPLRPTNAGLRDASGLQVWLSVTRRMRQFCRLLLARQVTTLVWRPHS